MASQSIEIKRSFEAGYGCGQGVIKKKKGKLVEPIAYPDRINVPAKCGEHVVFSIPTYVSEGGLEIFLGENDGERGFRFIIPSKVLLKAKRTNPNPS